MPARTFQPYLHDLVTQVSAPVVALSARSGQIAGGADGVYLGDRRVLSRLLITFSGDEPSPVDAVPDSAADCEFLGVLRRQGDTGPDPTVVLTRRRALSGEGMTETVEVHSSAREAFAGTLRVRAACDLAEMSAVKSGGQGSPLTATVDDSGWRWSAPDGTTVTLHASGAAAGSRSGEPGSDGLEWTVRLAPGERFALTLTLGVEQPAPPLGTPAKGGLPRVRVQGHPHLDTFLRRSIEDLDALVMADPEEPADRYVAAGAPWYLTLFGRDSLWTARMLLATGTELAGETLRVLARRQGTRDDPESAEQPGKIMHEFRTAPTEHHGGDRAGAMSLPPLYYGTIDATPLWVLLLHDAWRWGLPEREVAALMPNAERAMSWVRTAAESGQGFLSYRDESGHGLSNQGWKDSGDAIQFRDGRLAEAPIALCEVQGYAHQAALGYAALLDRFGGEGAGQWRAWAADLAERFRAAYWIEDGAGRYPATALDAAGQPVDTVTSNIGHLLGTGLLSAEEEQLVVGRLASPLMDSGFGLRTLAADSHGFNPLSYHAGSVWTHDTAIAVMGLVASGATDADRVAASLVDGLVRAARTFDYRMPELYGGHARAERSAPPPYPAACRPQAWSAASAVAVLTAALGIEPDAPEGLVRFRPLRPWPLGRIRVEGLLIAGRRVDVTVDEQGRPSVAGLEGLRLVLDQ